MEKELKAVRDAGFSVEELTPYQFRIEGHIDLYPKRMRFHNIRTQERGYFPRGLVAFIREQVAKTEGPSESKHVSSERMKQAGWWTKYTDAGK